MTRSFSWLALVGLLATVGGCKLPCPEGLESVDGQCISAATGEGLSLDQRGHPPCSLVSPSDRLDLEAGCADGACDGEPYVSLANALGPGLCEASVAVSETTFCEWQGGVIRSHFDDIDLDGVPDAGAGARGIYLSEGYDGSTPTGLGLRVSLACFYEVYGEPDEEVRVRKGSIERVVGMVYRPSGTTMFVDDESWLEDSAFDGHSGSLSLHRP